VREPGIELVPGLKDDGELLGISVMLERFNQFYVEESLCGQL
jgi:hypothetical protein